MSTTPSMSLPLPDPEVTAGPEWAQTINDAFTVLDTHSHVTGEGVPITPAAMNINEDLSINSYSLTEVGAVYLNDLDADITERGVYAKDGNLFYFNTDGDAVQITNGSTIAGATGSITGLSSPAGAAYSSLTKSFSWTYDSSKHAKSSHADLQLFPYDGSTAYTKSVTIKTPTALESGSSYSLTLPTALPASGYEYISVNSSGVLDTAAITGAANQINVSAGASSIALSLPQDIGTGSSPTFAGITTSAAILGATTVTTLVGSSASLSGPLSTGTISTGDGAVKFKVFTGTLAAGATATLSITGDILGAYGYSTNSSSLSGVWTPMVNARVPTTTSDDMIDFRYNISTTSAVGIKNYDSVSTNAYRVVVIYQ